MRSYKMTHYTTLAYECVQNIPADAMTHYNDNDNNIMRYTRTFDGYFRGVALQEMYKMP